MGVQPTPARVTSAREGLISANGRLPPGWLNECADSIAVEQVDLGPKGPAITLTLGFAATNEAPFVSVVLGDYLAVPSGGIAALRLDVELSRMKGTSAAFLIVREWIAGGTYVGQATRPIELGQGLVPASAARMATGDSRLFQALLTFRRDAGDGHVTARLARVRFADLNDYPAWLSS